MATKARIRLDEDRAFFLEELLHETRHRLVIRRADAKSRGEDLAGFQIRIGNVDRIQTELERAIREAEWLV